VNGNNHCDKCNGALIYEETDDALGTILKCINCGKRYFECDFKEKRDREKDQSYDFIQIRKAGYFKPPVVTVWKSGRICINATALRIYNPNNFQYADLFYDKKKKAFGIKFVEKGNNSFALINHLQDGCERKIIDTRSLLKHLEIKIEKPMKFPLSYDKESELLVFELWPRQST